MPRAAADTPRKMLPPPTTRQTSTPRLRTWATSAAICATMPGSIPYSRLPIRASPEIFSRTRLYLGGLDLGGLYLGGPSAPGCVLDMDPFCTLTAGTRMAGRRRHPVRSEEHTSELQSLMRSSYAG